LHRHWLVQKHMYRTLAVLAHCSHAIKIEWGTLQQRHLSTAHAPHLGTLHLWALGGWLTPDLLSGMA